MMRMLVVTLALCLMASGPAAASGPARPQAASSGFVTVAPRAEVARAGALVLHDGGTAADAAVAMAFAMCVTQPHVASLGGEAVLLYYDAKSRSVVAYDGLASAPSGLTEKQYHQRSGRMAPRQHLPYGGISVGVPGVVRLLSKVYGDHGALAWQDLATPAIELALQGVPLGYRVWNALADAPFSAGNPEVQRRYYRADQTPRTPDEIIVHRRLAVVLDQLAREGADSYYSGELAEHIVNAVRLAPRWPGGLSDADVLNYAARRTDAVCHQVSGDELCTTPMPTAGPALLETLAVAHIGHDSPNTHRLVEASRVALSDFSHWVADSTGQSHPSVNLLDAEYLKTRAAAIRPAAGGEYRSGLPKGASEDVVTGPLSGEPHHWASVVATDRQGNVAVLSLGLGGPFGSGILVDGSFLNAAVARLAVGYRPEDKKPLNLLAPGRRPASRVAPVIAVNPEGGLFRLALGGGASLSESAWVLDHALEGQNSLHTMLSRARVVATPTMTLVEPGGPKQELESLGHTVKTAPSPGHLLGIHVQGGLPTSGLDTRGVGCALSSKHVFGGQCRRSKAAGACIDSRQWDLCQ